MPDLPAFTDIDVQRLLCAIFPSRLERVLCAVKTWAWHRSDTGVFGRLGDWADDRELAARSRRARRRLAKTRRPVR